MSAQRKKDKCMKEKPKGLGWPAMSATLKKRPKTLCVTRYVSGFATSKEEVLSIAHISPSGQTFGI
jgi:hypothetical protein